MGELYVGTKFQTRFARRAVPSDQRVGELLQWCRRFAALGVVGDTVGNLSIRTAQGFLINRAAADLGAMTRQELVEVLEADIAARVLTVVGVYEPSSEAMMHAALYAVRPELNAVVHGHSDELLAAAERRGWPVTEREQPYGTPELVAEIQKILDGHDFFVLRNHGFVALGQTLAEAGRRVEEALARL
jgi:L-fuculose-phosphate aldolase